MDVFSDATAVASGCFPVRHEPQWVALGLQEGEATDLPPECPDLADDQAKSGPFQQLLVQMAMYQQISADILRIEEDEPAGSPSESTRRRARAFAHVFSAMAVRAHAETGSCFKPPVVCLSHTGGYSFNWRTEKGFVNVTVPEDRERKVKYFYQGQEAHELVELNEALWRAFGADANLDRLRSRLLLI